MIAPTLNCGCGGGDCSDCALGDLSNVDTTGASDGDVLGFNGATWEPVTGGGGKLACADLNGCSIDDLGDVTITTPANGQILAWDTDEWVNQDLNIALALDDLTDVDASAPTDGQVLTFDNGTGDWIAADVPRGVKDFAEAVVTGGNGDTPATTYGDVTNLADITLDASVGDLIGVAWNTITFGGQTFYRVSSIVSAAVAVSRVPIGWYKTSNLSSEGVATSTEFKFLVTAPDLDGATITLRMEGKTTGGTGIVLQDSQFQATNYGPVGA